MTGAALDLGGRALAGTDGGEESLRAAVVGADVEVDLATVLVRAAGWNVTPLGVALGWAKVVDGDVNGLGRNGAAVFVLIDGQRPTLSTSWASAGARADTID